MTFVMLHSVFYLWEEKYMPHSSGGGSSHGSHGGSSHHSSSGRGGSSFRESSSYFPGSRRYSYFYRGRTHYYYSNKSPNDSKFRFLLILFYIPFFFGIGVMTKQIFGKYAKIKVDYNDTIVVEDNIEVVKDEAGLYKSFADFQSKTGITPALVTIKYEDYALNYNSLEDYAYSEYLIRFNDEKHWLFVYEEVGDPDKISIPVDSVHYPDPAEPAWAFEGMQGNDTDPILTTEVTDKFNAILRKKLLEGESPDKAFSYAFDQITPTLMKFKWSPEMIAPLFMFGFVVLHMILMCGLTPKQLAKRKAVLAPGGEGEDALKTDEYGYIKAANDSFSSGYGDNSSPYSSGYGDNSSTYSSGYGDNPYYSDNYGYTESKTDPEPEKIDFPQKGSKGEL